MNEATSPQPRSSSATGTPSSSPISRLRNGFRRSWKVLTLIVLLLTVIFGGIAYYLHEPTYTSEAWLLIKERPDVILKSLDSDSEQFLRNQMEFIRSPRVLGPLAQNPAILATPELEHEPDVALALGQRIQIKRRGMSDIYIVSFSSVSPEKAELVVQKVTESYLSFYAKAESAQDDRLIRLLEEQRAARYEEMNQLRDNVRSLSLQLTGIDPFHAKSPENELAMPANLLLGLQDKLIQYELDQEFLAAQIKEAENRQVGANTTGEAEQSSAAKLPALKEEYAATSMRLRIVKEKIQKTLGSAKQYAGGSLELEFRRAKLEQVTRIHNQISDRILSLTTEQRAPPRVELFKEASRPSQADGWRFGHLREIAQAAR